MMDQSQVPGGKAGGAAAGAATGAAAGAALGPIGALAGAAIGAGASLYDSSQQEKAAEKANPQPKRRKLKDTQNAVEERSRAQLSSMATLSQAAMEWANMVR